MRKTIDGTSKLTGDFTEQVDEYMKVMGYEGLFIIIGNHLIADFIQHGENAQLIIGRLKKHRRVYYKGEHEYNAWALIATLAGIVVALITENLHIGISSLQGCVAFGIIYFASCKVKGME